MIIDLTHKIHANMPHFDAPWHTGVSIEALGYLHTVGRNTSKIEMGSHTGTHMDAASHFMDDGQTIDRVPLTKMVGPVTVVDFSYFEKNHVLQIIDLKDIVFSKRMIFFFGWGKYWQTSQFYQNYPSFSSDAAQYLVDAGVKVIGLDTPSPDDSRTKLLSSEDSKIHKIFLRNGITLVEYLANLDKVDTTEKWNLCAVPLPIENGDGCPVRAFLFSNDELV